MDALRSREYDGGSEFIEQVCEGKLLLFFSATVRGWRTRTKEQELKRENERPLFYKKPCCCPH
jgi:hypothetical protein